MKSIDNVNKIIKNFFSAQINVDVNVTCDLDFHYTDASNEVAWSLFTNERQERTFIDFIENKLSCPICNSFIYSIFHELGHKMTFKNFDDIEWMLYELALEKLDEIEDYNKRDYIYYNLFVERAASEWAVNFIKANHSLIKKWFDEELLPALEAVFQEKEFQKVIEELEVA